MNKLLVVPAILLLSLSNVCLAESVTVQVGQQGDAKTVKRPARGSSSAQVIERFGSPTQQSPSVGEPPISRWVYDNFTVFFDGNYVIHSVVHP